MEPPTSASSPSKREAVTTITSTVSPKRDLPLVPPDPSTSHSPRRPAPPGSNMFTRFIKTSDGANLCTRMPLSTAAQQTIGGQVRLPLKPSPRRQIGILCNSMPTLDMVELAHRVVPPVTLGSPRFVEEDEALLGDAHYDFKKFERATTKANERADAALGQRASVSVVFYGPNPGALTSRRDFRLFTVPNHRDIQETLQQLELSKKQPRCANHATACFEPPSSDEEDNVAANRAALKQQGKTSKGPRRPPSLSTSAREAGTGAPEKGSPKGSPTLASMSAGRLAGADAEGSAFPASGAKGQRTATHQAHRGHSSGGCECIHCNYVRDELENFERRVDASPRSTRGESKPSGAKKSSSRAGGARANNPGDHSAVDFLTSQPAFPSILVATPSSPLAAPLTLVQHLMRLQDAFRYLRNLEVTTQVELRLAVLRQAPSLRLESIGGNQRSRRLLLVDFFGLMATGKIIAPRVRRGETSDERFALPQRPIYAVQHLTRQLQSTDQNGSSATTPASVFQRGQSFLTRDAASTSAANNNGASAISSEVLRLVRPWELYFHRFDSDTTGVADKFQVLLPILATTAHVVPLAPDTLKYDSRLYTNLTCVVLLLSQLLTDRTPTEGPVRLGEVFAIRDFLVGETQEAAKVAQTECVGWADDEGTIPLPEGRRRDLLKSFSAASNRVADFQRSAEAMLSRGELLGGAQLVSVLQETLLVGAS